MRNTDRPLLIEDEEGKAYEKGCSRLLVAESS